MSFIRRKQQNAFTLVEIVLALGLFALSILAIVGLLGPILDSARDVEEREIASNLNQLIRAELERLPFEKEGGTMGESIALLGLSANGPPFVLYGNRDLSEIGPSEHFENPPADPVTGEPRQIGDADKFFRIELHQPEAFPFDEGQPDRYASRTFEIQVYWPVFRRTGPGPNDAEPFRDDYTNIDPPGLSELNQSTFFSTIRRQ